MGRPEAAGVKWQNELANGQVLLVDGGTGSELRRRGANLSPVAWSAGANLERRDLLVEIHRDYILAGADVVTANTFGTTRFVLAAAGLGPRWREANVAAVTAAQEARAATGRDVAIAASLSCLPPGFDPNAYPDPATELAAYRASVELFAELGVDLVLLEMMQEPVHAALACAAASDSGLPFWLGISCRLAVGTLAAFDMPEHDIDETLDALLRFAPAAVTVMHSPVDAVVPAFERIRTRWSGPLGAYAEIPYPEDPAAAPAAIPAERMSPESYAAHARHWCEAGARIIGGCCGTTPAHIAALAAGLSGYAGTGIGFTKRGTS